MDNGKSKDMVSVFLWDLKLTSNYCVITYYTFSIRFVDVTLKLTN